MQTITLRKPLFRPGAPKTLRYELEIKQSKYIFIDIKNINPKNFALTETELNNRIRTIGIMHEDKHRATKTFTQLTPSIKKGADKVAEAVKVRVSHHCIK